jgi:hypothetical protein
VQLRSRFSFIKLLRQWKFTQSFPDMNKPNTDCDELLTSTAQALNKETQKLLLLSTQRNNADLCIEQVVKEWASCVSACGGTNTHRNNAKG